LVKEADYRHRRLLRLRDKRPCDRGAAEQCDEVTPFQLFEWHPMPHEPDRGQQIRFRRVNRGLLALVPLIHT
jgi:hypothetical protein